MPAATSGNTSRARNITARHEHICCGYFAQFGPGLKAAIDNAVNPDLDQDLQDLVVAQSEAAFDDRPRAQTLAQERIKALDAKIAELQAARTSLARLAHACATSEA